MNEYQEQNIETTQDYQRRRQRYDKKRHHRLEKKQGYFSEKIEIGTLFYILICSIFVSICSVTWPFLSELANNGQSYHLYIAQITIKGLLPYSQLFTQSGIGHIGLLVLGALAKTNLVIILGYTVASYVSGVYFYKIVLNLIDEPRLSRGILGVFYFLLFAYGFGGVSSGQLALPFLLLAVWFLLRYSKDQIGDEGFVGFGIAISLASLFEPRSLLFWLIASLFLFIRQMVKKQFARNFYQLLCFIFGSLIVLYITGYFILNMQLLSVYMSQTGIDYLFNPIRSNEDFLTTVGFQLGVFCLSGLGIWGVFSLLKKSTFSENAWFNSLIGLTALVYSLYGILSRSFSLEPWGMALPFGLLFGSNFLGSRYQEKVNKVKSHRITRSPKGFTFVMGSVSYLPVLILLYAILQPLSTAILNHELNTERENVANYLKTEVKADEKVYVWDDSSKIYLNSLVKPSSRYATPSVVESNSKYQKELLDTLLADDAKYVVINTHLSIPEEVVTNLSKNYQKISFDKTKTFKLYQVK